MNTAGTVDCVSRYYEFPETTKNNTCHVCLSTGAVVGLSFHAQMGFISLLALLILVGVIGRNYKRNRALDRRFQRPLFRGNVDILMLNLIVADILMSFGAISDVHWANQRQVYCGSYCNAQGVVQTMGETSAALSTLAVAIYTFLAIQRDRHPRYRPGICLVTVVVIWLWVLLWAVVPLAINRSHDLDEKGVQNFYTPTPWWCWINGRYLPERIIGEYLWLWIAGIGSIVLYVPAYFTVHNRKEAVHEPNSAKLSATEQSEQDARSIASSINDNNEAAKMLWYPLVYTLCVLPLSIIRWAGFVHPDLLTSLHMLAPSMVFSSVFNLMGLFNTLLIWCTRPAILLLDFDQSNFGESAVSLENIGARASRVTSRASAGLNQRAASHHDRETTDETLTNPRPVNRFGGADVSLNREF